MNDIQKIMNDTLEEKFNDGTIEKMVSDRIDKFINSTISSCLDSWSEPSQILKKKVENTMVSVIENHDFDDYLTKFDTVITECLKSSVIAENKQLLKNLSIIFKEDNTEKEITIEQMFERYENYIENHFDAEDNNEIDWNTDDGECAAYMNIKCDVTQNKNWLSSREESYSLTFSCENMRQQFKVNVNKYDWENKFNIHFYPDIELRSLRFADEFTLYLLNLSQRDVKINVCEEQIYKDEVLVTKEED